MLLAVTITIQKKTPADLHSTSALKIPVNSIKHTPKPVTHRFLSIFEHFMWAAMNFFSFLVTMKYKNTKSMNITVEHVTNMLNDKVPTRSHQELSFMFMVRWARWVPKTVITGTPGKQNSSLSFAYFRRWKRNKLIVT